MEKNSKGMLEVVEYREGDKVIRLFLRRQQEGHRVVMDDIENLQFYRRDPGPIYQVFFRADGRDHCHEYPIHEVARTEEECLPEES